MGQDQIFLDTDVIISSLLSSKGASFQVLTNLQIAKVISKVVKQEVKEVCQRHDIDYTKGKRNFKNFRITTLKLRKQQLITKYIDYVTDEGDSHIVAGANDTQSPILLTYNIKHFNVEKIKRELGIIVMRPGEYLQYLRSKQ